MPKVEYRWKIKYPDGPSAKSPWMEDKRKVIEHFFEYKTNEGQSAEDAFQDATEAAERRAESPGPHDRNPFPEKDEVIYLDKRIALPDRQKFYFFGLGKQNYVGFRWKVKARLYRQEQDFTYLKGDWTPDFEECIQHYKEVSRVGYDVVDCCGTQDYLYMRKLLPAFQRLSDA